jgi:hypothetical protein
MQRNRRQVENFGGNLRMRPEAYCVPADEAGVLALLREHRGRRVRAVGALHSWSQAPLAEDVLVDLRRLRGVSIERRGERLLATVGAGCRIKEVLAELQRLGGWTLPTIGLVSEQTIAGAVSTGTHGSGRHSLSHYVAAVRLAHYDPTTGEPVVRTIDGGDALRAARCAVGCLGLLLAVTCEIRPQYQVEETLRECGSLDEVLAGENTYPLQQFYLVPWSWRWLVQQRREVRQGRSPLAWLYRLYWWLFVDWGLHLLVVLLARWWRWRRGVQELYRRVLGTVIQGWRVVDRSDRQLIMEHELFRHIETELFVTREELAGSLAVVRELIECCGGSPEAVSAATREAFSRLGLLDELQGAAGCYTHHYVICVRKVLADATWISMSSGESPRYAISLISYVWPQDRAGFFRFASLAARSLAALHGARPHWGKLCPLDAAVLRRLYPRWGEFRAQCLELDPAGVFRNRWFDELLAD